MTITKKLGYEVKMMFRNAVQMAKNLEDQTREGWTVVKVWQCESADMRD